MELLLSKGAEVDSRDNVSTYNNVMYCVTHMEIFGCNNLAMLLQGSKYHGFAMFSTLLQPC